MRRAISPFNGDPPYDNMTKQQVEVFAKQQEGLLSRMEEALSNARSANDAIVRLPFYNEKNKRVSINCNEAMRRTERCWLEMAQISYQELIGDKTKEIYEMENRVGMSIHGKVLG